MNSRTARPPASRREVLLGMLTLAACAKTSTTTPPTEPEAMPPDPQLAADEVIDLHRFFLAWFTAERPDTDEAFERFAGAMHADFEMVVPSGALVRRADLLEGLRGAHGSWTADDTASIEVRSAESRSLAPELVLVSYEEWQRRDGTWTARRSTALLRRAADAPGGWSWVHVHETWMDTGDGG